jgi:hypothetical protein
VLFRSGDLLDHKLQELGLVREVDYLGR